MMTLTGMDRREVLAAGAVIGAAGLFAGEAAAQVAPAPAMGPAYAPQPMPLAFDPKAVPGLSERLLTSHHDNNYVGAVKRLGAIGAELAALDPASTPGYRIKRAQARGADGMEFHAAP